MSTSTITHQALVTKDNKLVDLLHTYSLNELRLIAFCVAHYDSRKENVDNRIRGAHVADLVKIFPTISINSAYNIIDKAIVSINTKPLRFQEGNRKKMRVWFSGLDYVEGEGIFEFILSEDIIPYLINLKNAFTSIKLEDVYQFESAKTWVLYELLRVWLSARKKTFLLEDLKQKLGYAEGEYKEWQDFKKRILSPHLAIINEKTDLDIEYTYVKKRNKIIGLNFSIYPADHTTDTVTIESSSEEVYRRLLNIGITEEKSNELLTLIEQKDRLFTIKASLEKKIKASKKKRKPTGWIISWITGECSQQHIGDVPAKITRVECLKKMGTECSRRLDRNLDELYSFCKECRAKYDEQTV